MTPTDSTSKESAVKRPEQDPVYNPIEAALLGRKPIPRPPREPGPSLKARWNTFKGNDSSASVAFGCASILLTIMLAFATLQATYRANELLDRQNELILAGALPAVSAFLTPLDTAGYTLSVQNNGPRANFRSIEPMTLLRFTFENFEGNLEGGYIAVYDVFSDIRLNSAGTGILGSASSVADVDSVIDDACEAVVSADSRILECDLEISLVVRYQTNTDELYRNYYHFDDLTSTQVPGSELDSQVNRWDDEPNDRTAFSIHSPLPEDMDSWIEEYVERRSEPLLGFPLS